MATLAVNDSTLVKPGPTPAVAPSHPDTQLASIITAYARALASARLSSLQILLRNDADKAEKKERSKPLAFSRAFRALLSLRGNWMARRKEERRQRELEAVLRNLDIHTLNDIGFDVTMNPPAAPGPDTLVHAVKIICATRRP
jgi:hypothetical protein